MTPGKIHTDSVKGKMFVADGGKSVEGLLEPTGEPFRPEMQAYADAKELGVHDMWKLQAERSHLQQQYLDQWMSHDGLDAILGECSPWRCVLVF
jgi:amidase